jgi:hypothetical protein
MRKLLYIVSLLLVVVACQKEIELDYRDIEPVVSIEGRVTNGQVYVLITRTRSMNDSVKSRGIGGAVVTISSEDGTEQLVYDARDGYYRPASGMKGVAGRTYRLDVTLDGHQYAASSTMPRQAPIVSTQFIWQSLLDNGMLMYEMWASDPEPDVRNYYWYRVDRRAKDPKVRQKQGTDAYRWSSFDDRGAINARIYRDIMCVNEEMMDGQDIEDDQLKSILFDGDTITLQLMTIDRAMFEYYQSLSVGQRMGANPISNISGGCLGYFAAGSVSHADTVIYNKNIILRK